MDIKALLESGYELLIESGFTIEFNKASLKESCQLSESKKGALVITLPVCKLDTPTANGRIYTSKMMESAIERAKDAIVNRRLLCSADDHPTTTHVPPINASHAVVDAWVKEGLLWNKWEITGTTNGQNLRALAEGGFAVGTSIRGLGRISVGKQVEDYNYLGTDGVGNPAAGTYALPGAGGVTLEIVESVSLKEDEYYYQHVLKKHGFYKDGNLHFHPSGDYLDIDHDGATHHHGDDTHIGYFETPSELEAHLDKFYSRKTESKKAVREQRGLQIKGVGAVNQNGIIKFRGQTYRVSNIAGSGDQYQMTLYSLDPLAPSSLFVMSTDITDASKEIEVIKEGSEELKTMDKLTKVMDKVREAAEKLAKIKESGDVAAEMKFVAAFEYDLSSDSSLSGSELRKVQEAWDKEKTKKITKVEESNVKVPVELQIEQLNKNFSELSKMMESFIAPINAFTEEEQKMIALMKGAPYSLDEGAISEVLQAYLAHPDDEKSFQEELVTRLGNKVGSVDVGQLFRDITVASGDYTVSGGQGQSPNYPVTAVEQENETLNGLVKEFCDRVEAGELVQKEEVLAQLEAVISESRGLVRKHQIREALVTEMLVETLYELGPAVKKFKTYKEQYAKLWEASLVIIHQLKEDLNKSKVVVESIKESVEIPKVKSPARVPGWK